MADVATVADPHDHTRFWVDNFADADPDTEPDCPRNPAAHSAADDMAVAKPYSDPHAGAICAAVDEPDADSDG